MDSIKGKEPATTTWPNPADLHVAIPRKPLSQSSIPQHHTLQAKSLTSNNIPLAEGDTHNEIHSSNTWTPSTENTDLPPEEDGKDDRARFTEAYNQLAQRHGIRPLVPGDFPSAAGDKNDSLGSRRGSWLSKMLRQPSEQPKQQPASKPDKRSLRHQRSHSFIQNLHHNKRAGLKNLDLRALVRLCGKSPLFLPPDYAPFSLTLPTCFRALAQTLVQHADTKGIFRVSGSTRAVDALYDYYCSDNQTENVSTTTRCPTLPTHIRCNTHDVAGTFKRLLAGLPGGILGSLSLFDALVAIHSQLQGAPESHRTKESRLRARLIALAIGTVKSQYQRELICAVFGLLCLVGRIAENAPREDENGHPLPTTDLMGYHALGIVFGPLLVGDLINSYSMQLADPSVGLILLPLSTPRSRKEGHRINPSQGYDGGFEHSYEHSHIHEHKHEHKHRHEQNKHERIHEHKHRHTHRHKQRHTEGGPSAKVPPTMNRIHIANSIAEMLIVHWREVVRQIRDTGSVKVKRRGPDMPHGHPDDILRKLSLSASIASLSLEDPAIAPPTAGSSTASGITSSSNIRTQDDQQATKPPPPPPMLSPTIEESPSPRGEESRHSDEPPPLRLTRKSNTSETPGDASPVISVIQKEAGDTQAILPQDPADQWRTILASSKASMESLVKSAKERRLMRSSGIVSSRPSRETLVPASSNLMTPGRKPELTQRRSEPKLKPSTLSSQKSMILADTHRLNSSSALSIPPIRAMDAPSGDTPLPGRARRSPSKPIPGAVKAMTALFDNALRDSPGAAVEVVRSKASNNLSESNTSLGRETVDKPPIKINISRHLISSMNSAATVDKQPYQGESSQGPDIFRRSPTKPCGHTLRPVKKFTALRKEPQLSPERTAYDTNRNQPPKLGSMLPYPEEPPIGHFIRPSSATSGHGPTASTDDASFDPSIHIHRHVSGNSVLHAQIRSLQRQLEIRHEEILQVRRQLETQEQMDIGTLCEQLRIAKRECKMWRKRAEAAEKRLAIFQRFGAKFQALNDGVDEFLEKGKAAADSEAEMDCSLSSYSAVSEDQQLFAGGAITGVESGYGPFVNNDGDEVRGAGATEYHDPGSRSRRVVKLWADGRELIGHRQDDGTIVWD